MGVGPAEAEERAGLGLAGLEGNAAPTEFATEADDTPVMCALVEEERHALAHGVDVDGMFFKLIRERLFDVAESLPKFR
jgi:hypothetical protein